MKKLAVLVGVLVLMVSCKSPSQRELESQGINPIELQAVGGYNVQTVKLDECEYVVAKGVESISIIHKQNCKNHY